VTQTSRPESHNDLSLRAITPGADRQPGGRPPAPGSLRLVQAFVNTHWDIEGGTDRFDSTERLRDWLAGRGLLDPRTRLDQADLECALDVREGLRELLFANNGASADPMAVERLNRAIRSSGLGVRLDPVEPPDFHIECRDLHDALAVITTIVALAQLEGTWPRLKACRGPHCGWAFYDHSRNQAGRWCAMTVCGSRAKAREYRERHRAVRKKGP
jgi:predicted RNA-binding Zn ribbon-like protein